MDEFIVDYDLLKIERDPLQERLKSANKIVEQFIKDRQLIITGGMAIDIALRLNGDYIYDLNSANVALPDWDFYSPEHVKDAYDLTDILYESGIGDFGDDKNAFKIDCIRAMHETSLRVRLYFNSVADVSYVHPDVYAKIPFLTINGMKVVHPHWQMLNQHHALAYPLVNPPMEVVFHRLNKDITRHAKMINSYPFPKISAGCDMYDINWDFSYFKKNKLVPVLQGYSAYAAIYTIYKIYKLDMTDIHPAEISEKKFSSPINMTEFIVSEIPDLESVEGYFYEYMDNSLPIYKMKSKETLLFHFLDNNVIPVSPFSLDKDKSSYTVLIPQSNILLLYFLLGYHISDNKTIYGKFYTSLFYMIQRMSAWITTLIESGEQKNLNKARDIILNTPFFIPRKVYGIRNESKSYSFNRLNVIKDLQRYASIPQIDLPLLTRFHYRPQDKDSIPHTFDYENSDFFRISGKFIDLINKSEADLKQDLGVEGGDIKEECIDLTSNEPSINLMIDKYNDEEIIENNSDPGIDVTIDNIGEDDN